MLDSVSSVFFSLFNILAYSSLCMIVLLIRHPLIPPLVYRFPRADMVRFLTDSMNLLSGTSLSKACVLVHFIMTDPNIKLSLGAMQPSAIVSVFC